MRYLNVLWDTSCNTDPVRMVSEIDDAGLELRKLEFFADGSVGYACEAFKTKHTELGTDPIPSLSEINTDPQFQATETSVIDFEHLWQTYVKVVE